MVRLPAMFKKGLLDWIWDSVEAGSYPSILEAIKAQSLGQAPVVRGGQTILSAAGGGFNVTFAIPGSYSPQELFMFWTELRDIYYDALTALGDSATQEQLYDRMRASDSFESITSTQGDYSLLRAQGGWR